MANFSIAYAFPVALTIIGGLLYHTSSKHVPDLHPSVVLTMAYVLQLVFCIAWAVHAKAGADFSTAWTVSEGRHWILGLAIGSIVMEVGFILAYRAGWNLSAADITSVAVISLLFLLGETFVYGHAFNLKRMLGIILCVIGLVLINWSGLGNQNPVDG
ncbi:hypothetical protein [Pseudorhodoferax sp.]|uniref:hypothetical protein n=1 Tax=Pseudorhodoferax sp. TaxID=1993553 RepID=UPI002DD694A9|nr:hypothetical protein [Pseudorhodoferax sp.]